MKFSSIRNRILLPVIAIAILLGLIAYFLVAGMSRNKIEDLATDNSNAFQDIFYQQIESISDHALTVSAGFSGLEGLYRAYRMEDEDEGRALLRTLTADYLNNMRVVTGFQEALHIHFHKPPTQSFLRIWRPVGDGDGGDDLSSFRFSVERISRTQRPVRGIEMGRGGFVIRGLSPIFHNSNYLGSVESLFPFDELISSMVLNEDENLVVFADEESAEIAWRLQDNEQVGEFTFVTRDKNYNLSNIQAQHLRAGSESPFFTIDGRTAVSVFPLPDFKGDPVGVVYFSQQLDHIITSENRSMFTFIGIILLIIVSIILVVYYISSSFISAPINRINSTLSKVSQGDLSARLDIQQQDEIGSIGKSVNAMLSKISDTLYKVRELAESVNNASSGVSSVSQQMSEGATEQAASVEEVSSSMEEMAANIQQNTDNARATEKIAVNSENSMKELGELGKEAVGAMKEVADKISIISEISRQTNILALNAAVEAARAGEHGKGFAVVAAEVRKLAERSRSAAEEINSISVKGLTSNEKAGDRIIELLPEIQKNARLVQEIASASVEQSSGADQVNTSVQQINTLTQQNASSSEEMAVSSEELASQADQLLEMINQFKLSDQ